MYRTCSQVNQTPFFLSVLATIYTWHIKKTRYGSSIRPTNFDQLRVGIPKHKYFTIQFYSY
ncbi:hypothetical protein GIB67_011611 [Kingdonia uniflora]|uniref:Uncharacterized protein n=1 Tax=Kingdonia uniflora TaxID=39325 RepID=A0A7J7NM68_9MAGN|nr:hypothetical protein GIB67_011611 [Kingdonia uniflora]